MWPIVEQPPTGSFTFRQWVVLPTRIGPETITQAPFLSRMSHVWRRLGAPSKSLARHAPLSF